MIEKAQPQPVKVAALYQFRRVDDPAGLRQRLAAHACGAGIRGTLIVAGEGINGTVAGSADAVDGLVALLLAEGFDALELKVSEAGATPFHRMKVRLKREIVTLGVDGVDPQGQAGTYVDPVEWNALVEDQDTVVIDTRNDYEVALGSFRGAVDPATATFRDFPAWLEANRERLQGRKLAMYCTGGIRCEKATAYARTAGFDQVYHLKGGILRYLEDMPAANSLWQGECFVFDERVAVTHGLAPGSAMLCRACRHPLTEDDRRHPDYAEGLSCHRCAGTRSDADRSRYAERHRQVDLAQQRGVEHIGRRARD